MSRSLGALAVLCALLLASSSVQAARTLQASTCTVRLSGGLDAIAGTTDITLSHDCGLGYSQTNKVAGELTDFYQDSRTKCIFQDGKFQWCIHMEDGGGFNINSALSYGAFSQLTTCHPSSLTNLECDWTNVPSNTPQG
ncbi:TPA: hypothetical protein ACH3X2_001250 [Trebouxia sp. C0005]